ncbi:MAG: HAD hydrolase-like protein, partial [Oscillospiraceae bacterium]
PAGVMNQFIGPPLYDSFREYCGLSDGDARQAVQLFRARYGAVGLYENAVVPGLPNLLDRLRRRGYVLALASSKPEPLCRKIVEKFGYAPSLREVVGSSGRVDENKETVIRRTMARLRLGAGDCSRILMIGDRKFDVEGARACGLDCLGVTFCDYAPEGELAAAGAIAVVATVAELETFLCPESAQ